ncbi:hypothetical protein CTI12_AA579480 [Artemisia annua]|uniref:Reverse transcriptase zinc-binding domain-containing protein n=1 Tax=Artemisia annua TaxID=35608 RepID=A0A2U1KPD5_ARTAN|nr:hypothetical protein CTI12_AA579480 [Artemisia annua]
MVEIGLVFTVNSKALLCTLVSKRLSTQDRLCNWGISAPNMCMICQNGLESHDHMFFGCSYSWNVWRKLQSYTGCLVNNGELKSKAELKLATKLSIS